MLETGPAANRAKDNQLIYCTRSKWLRSENSKRRCYELIQI